jgi:hypothetical protein
VRPIRLAEPKRAKYGNKKVVTEEGTFDSRAEYARWRELKSLQAAGKVTDLVRQVPLVIAPGLRFPEAKRAQPALRLVVDFSYIEAGERVYEDVKSPATITPTFVAKRHALQAAGTVIRLCMR